MRKLIDQIAQPVASLLFLAGSVMFLPAFASMAVMGVWCFIGGSGILFLHSVSASA
ncbi:YrhK family protein [Aestuariibacter sp. AA17]|uniref:YrhK family protein n=1 Tax=Fluctibacter corallii TaxID=2984329 RepID=A0ABT3ACF2_9ALTE|nr:YrhK family protein [Aestuariibacter sp. AA17]MCV2886354.1 YrhK family protein [Aestuariibacter sp. AA17]